MGSVERICVTTFDGLPKDAIDHSRRRCGNSTRIADHAIQQLFAGEVVTVRDHKDMGRDEHANKFLFRDIVRRLHRQFNLDGSEFSASERTLTIHLYNYPRG